jgi:hypothetical protein
MDASQSEEYLCPAVWSAPQCASDDCYISVSILCLDKTKAGEEPVKPIYSNRVASQ